MALRGRILYRVGFDAAEAAITWQVAEMSKAWRTPVVLLGVQPVPWLSLFTGDRQRALKRQLLDVAKRMRGLKGHVAGIKAVIGDACTEAQRLANQVGAELIVTGAGVAAIGDPLAVSASAFDLAHRARQDVWICKPGADPHIEHVLCAADTSALAADAIRRSVDLCRRFNARLRLLSVLPEPGGADDPDEARAGPERQRRFLEQLDLRGVPLSRTLVRSAQTAVAVLLEAGRYADGLLVMGASSAPGASGLGATAAAVLRASPSSILLVRRRQAAALDAAPIGTAVACDDPADGGRGLEPAPTSPPSR